MKTTLIILTLITLISCTDKGEKSVAQNDRLELIPEPDKDLRVEYEQQQNDSLTTKTHQNDALKEKLQPIKKNVKRINEIKEWTSIDERDLEQSTEGGSATYYFKQDTLLKIVALHFGETGKVIQEFYPKMGSYHSYWRLNKSLTNIKWQQLMT